jgi:hypothetical protein
MCILFPWRNIHNTFLSSLSLYIYSLAVRVDEEIGLIMRLPDANSPRPALRFLRSAFRIDLWKVLIHRYLGSIWASLRMKMRKTSCFTNNQGYLCINSKSKNNIFIHAYTDVGSNRKLNWFSQDYLISHSLKRILSINFINNNNLY